MFGYKDEIELNVRDIINKKGETIPLEFSIPKYRSIELDRDMIKASIYETESNGSKKETNSYNVYIGELQTIENLQNNNEKYRIAKNITDTDDISKDDFVCCFKEEDKYVIFAKVNEEDIVVKNVREFEDVLIDLTTDLILAQNTLKRIKTHIYKKHQI